MPIYAYRCDECGFAKDVLQKISDPVLTVCLSCGKPSFKKQLTAAGFQLKHGAHHGHSDGPGRWRQVRPGCRERACRGACVRSTGRQQNRLRMYHGAGEIRLPPPPPERCMRKYFITGLLILVPLAITAWVLNLVISTMDQSLLLVPGSTKPSVWFGHQVPALSTIPGLGTVLTVLIVFFTGLLTNNLVGNYVVKLWEKLLQRIPIVNSLYSSVKQVSDTLFSPSGNAFRKAVLVPYPHQNSWTIAFLTGVPGGDAANHLVGDYVSVYVPTTPNPTSGFFLMMKRSDVVELDMSVDAALKYIVSMGVVAPAEVVAVPAPAAKE